MAVITLPALSVSASALLFVRSCASREMSRPNVAASPLTVIVYRGGTPAKTHSLPPHSSAAVVFDSVLQKPADRWSTSFVSYAPGVLVRGESFELNFQRRQVILVAPDTRGRPSQWVSNLTESEYAAVERAADHPPTGP